MPKIDSMLKKLDWRDGGEGKGREGGKEGRREGEPYYFGLVEIYMYM